MRTLSALNVIAALAFYNCAVLVQGQTPPDRLTAEINSSSLAALAGSVNPTLKRKTMLADLLPARQSTASRCTLSLPQNSRRNLMHS
jgi:hypothetical protein